MPGPSASLKGALQIGLALLSTVAWLQPPAVLPLPSRTGADGPPRPFGVEPPTGANPAHTDRSLARMQSHALLYGPFPRGGLARGVSDGALMLSQQADVRTLTMSRIRALGGSVARIPVDWRSIVQATPPAGFQPRDPASPAYRFSQLDAAVLSAAAAGLQPLLVVSHAPAFAEAPNRWPHAYPGSWAPSGAALGDFAAALARRYDGAFPDPLRPGSTLPRVRLLQAWNEPNLARYLEPQWVASGRRWSAFSPLLYRQLLNGFYAGVKSVQPGDTVLAAGIAPEGEPAGVGAMAPVSFLEGLLCLRGAARTNCTQRPHLDVLAFHPLSVGNPDAVAASSLDASIADIAKITGLLARAERLRTVLPAGRRTVWVTELNWKSSPPSSQGVPGPLQAGWISRALHRLWVAGVSVVDWQFLIDPYGGTPLALPDGGLSLYPRPAGLYAPGPEGDTALARPKPFLRGFTLPFDPLRVNRRQVRVWALLMYGRQPALLQRQGHDGRWRTIARLRSDRSGVLNRLLRLNGAAGLRLRVGGLSSASERVSGGRSSL
ncbi:MAG TPA: hypothetical protein VK781_14670 [Solirubrobacteraceae bacterium]|jgi:hypothetical protein|nr:hypothetical protein [Solirubrobacteraceae bacterium]